MTIFSSPLSHERITPLFFFLFWRRSPPRKGARLKSQGPSFLPWLPFSLPESRSPFQDRGPLWVILIPPPPSFLPPANRGRMPQFLCPPFMPSFSFFSGAGALQGPLSVRTPRFFLIESSDHIFPLDYSASPFYEDRISPRSLDRSASGVSFPPPIVSPPRSWEGRDLLFFLRGPVRALSSGPWKVLRFQIEFFFFFPPPPGRENFFSLPDALPSFLSHG